MSLAHCGEPQPDEIGVLVVFVVVVVVVVVVMVVVVGNSKQAQI